MKHLVHVGCWPAVRSGAVTWVKAPEWHAVAWEMLEQAFRNAKPLPGAAGRAPLMQADIFSKHYVLRKTARGGMLRRMRPEGFSSPERFYMEVEASEKLRWAGVPTPRILAMRLEEKGGAWHGWILLERLEGLSIAEALRGGREEARERYLAAAALGRDVLSSGVAHADFHAGNVFVDAKGKSWVLDLDKARVCRGGAPAVFALCAALRFLRHAEKLRLAGAPVPRDWDTEFIDGIALSGGRRAMLRFLFLLQKMTYPLRRLFWRRK